LKRINDDRLAKLAAFGIQTTRIETYSNTIRKLLWSREVQKKKKKKKKRR
jgi:hypothetical protein